MLDHPVRGTGEERVLLMEHQGGVGLLDQLEQPTALRKSALKVVKVLVPARLREESIAKRLPTEVKYEFEGIAVQATIGLARHRDSPQQLLGKVKQSLAEGLYFPR